jgi:nitronate monooxygenase
VIAAGGIGDGRGIAATFTLGAAAVQIGTAFLLCAESATPALYREALKNARVNQTVVTNVLSGRLARAFSNRLATEIGPWSDAAPDFPLPLGELSPLSVAAERNGSTDFTPLWSGQAAALAREMPAKMLIDVLVRETTELGELRRPT